MKGKGGIALAVVIFLAAFFLFAPYRNVNTLKFVLDTDEFTVTGPEDFTVPLSGSKLFDTHAYVAAKGLCDKFSGLEFDYSDTSQIRIYGSLNDYWLKKLTPDLHMGYE